MKRSYVRCCCNTHFLHKRHKCTTDPCFIISLNAVQVSFTFYMHSKQTLSNIVCWLFTVTSLICLENGVVVHESLLWPKRVSHKQTLQKWSKQTNKVNSHLLNRQNTKKKSKQNLFFTFCFVLLRLVSHLSTLLLRPTEQCVVCYILPERNEHHVPD